MDYAIDISILSVSQMKSDNILLLAVLSVLYNSGCERPCLFGYCNNIFLFWTPISVSGIVCTTIFLYHHGSVIKYFCHDCTDCCLLPPAQVSVYDPDNPQLELVWRNGRVEEVFREGEKDIKENEEKMEM